MLSFLRRLRRSALGEKAAGYSRYAVGEIVLVVIGILIALQINNWNEARIERRQERKILQSLVEDLRQAETRSLELIGTEETSIRDFERVLGDEAAKQSLLNEPKVDSLFYEILFSTLTTAPIINAYADLKSAGQTGLISNDDIRRRFTALESRLSRLKLTLADRLEVQQQRVDPILVDDINFVRSLQGMSVKYDVDYGAPNDYAALLRNQRFLNAIAFKLSMTDHALTNRNDLLAEIRELADEIDQEICCKR